MAPYVPTTAGQSSPIVKRASDDRQMDGGNPPEYCSPISDDEEEETMDPREEQTEMEETRSPPREPTIKKLLNPHEMLRNREQRQFIRVTVRKHETGPEADRPICTE